MYDAALLFYDQGVFNAAARFMTAVTQYGGTYAFNERRRSQNPHAIRHDRFRSALLGLTWSTEETCVFMLYLPRVDDGTRRFDELRAQWECLRETYCAFEDREFDLTNDLQVFRETLQRAARNDVRSMVRHRFVADLDARVVGGGDAEIELTPAVPHATPQIHQYVGPQIDWHSTTHWTAPSVDGWMAQYPIREMLDSHLVDTVDWLVVNVLRLFKLHHTDYRGVTTFAAPEWLLARPVFRALVEEVVRRELTLPHTTFAFLKEWVFIQGTRRVDAPSWVDDEMQREILREERTAAVESRFGQLRQIEFLNQDDDQTGNAIGS